MKTWVESKKCVECGSEKNLKRGWSNYWYCSESCESRGILRLVESIPGAGKCPHGLLPYDLAREIASRWEER